MNVFSLMISRFANFGSFVGHCPRVGWLGGTRIALQNGSIKTEGQGHTSVCGFYSER